MDLAEGESDTVDESIRIHEQKGDLKRAAPVGAGHARPASKKPRKT
jgi:hypothetical protein